MFAVVEIKEDEKGVFRRIKNRIKKPMPVLERINVSGDAYFYRLELFQKQIRDNPNIFTQLLGPCASRIIFAGGRFPDSKAVYGTFRVQGYLQLILINTALSLIKSRQREYKRLSLCFVDKKGEYSGCFESFAHISGDVTLVTQEPSQYESVCEKLFREYGISVVVKDSAGRLSDYDFTVSPEFDIDKALNNSVIIRNTTSGMCDVLRGHEVSPDGSIKSIIPPGINMLEFVYALYRFCRIDRLGGLCFSDFKVVGSVR